MDDKHNSMYYLVLDIEQQGIKTLVHVLQCSPVSSRKQTIVYISTRVSHMVNLKKLCVGTLFDRDRLIVHDQTRLDYIYNNIVPTLTINYLTDTETKQVNYHVASNCQRSHQFCDPIKCDNFKECEKSIPPFRYLRFMGWPSVNCCLQSKYNSFYYFTLFCNDSSTKNHIDDVFDGEGKGRSATTPFSKINGALLFVKRGCYISSKRKDGRIVVDYDVKNFYPNIAIGEDEVKTTWERLGLSCLTKAFESLPKESIPALKHILNAWLGCVRLINLDAYWCLVNRGACVLSKFILNTMIHYKVHMPQLVECVTDGFKLAINHTNRLCDRFELHHYVLRRTAVFSDFYMTRTNQYFAIRDDGNVIVKGTPQNDIVYNDCLKFYIKNHLFGDDDDVHADWVQKWFWKKCLPTHPHARVAIRWNDKHTVHIDTDIMNGLYDELCIDEIYYKAKVENTLRGAVHHDPKPCEFLFSTEKNLMSFSEEGLREILHTLFKTCKRSICASDFDTFLSQVY